MDCHARGEVPIAVRWLRNGAKVEDDDRVRLLPNGSLQISPVESSTTGTVDAGFYQCLAQNQYGAILSQKSQLTVAGECTCVAQPESVACLPELVSQRTLQTSLSGSLNKSKTLDIVWVTLIMFWKFVRELPVFTLRVTVTAYSVRHKTWTTAGETIMRQRLQKMQLLKA